MINNVFELNVITKLIVILNYKLISIAMVQNLLLNYLSL
jgi:hypothetical protein